jgi:hypothetical protein
MLSLWIVLAQVHGISLGQFKPQCLDLFNNTRVICKFQDESELRPRPDFCSSQHTTFPITNKNAFEPPVKMSHKEKIMAKHLWVNGVCL